MTNQVPLLNRLLLRVQAGVGRARPDQHRPAEMVEGRARADRRITLPYTALRSKDWQRLYVERLDQIDVNDLAQRFADLSARHDNRPLVLCCFEKNPAECHRSILAGWLEAHGSGRCRR